MKNNNTFIKLHVISRDWDGTKYGWVDTGRNVICRLDSVIQIPDLYSDTVFASHDELLKSHYGDTTPPPERKITTLTTSAVRGLGINGVDASLTIDEDSYNRLVKALGVEDL